MKPHIIIDARLYGPKNTGIGRYTKNLLVHLINQKDFKKYNFTVILYKEHLAEAKTDLKNNYNYVTTDIKHYSLSEQIFLPHFLKTLNPDLVHFTHFNKPIFYFGKSIITIHDLIKHFYRGKDTTTKTPLLYWPKYLFYLIITFINIKLNKLIVPSNYWRNYIIDKFRVNPNNITTTYEAIDPNFLDLKNLSQKIKTDNYLLYTGNLYPHKNIDIILKALPKIPHIKLKVISARSVFTHRLEKLIHQYKIKNQVEILGYVPDKQFPKIYSKALCLIHPSFMEGFSLTGLEAMALDCPVISSNSSCLPEIYHDSVLYFDPEDTNQLVDQINMLKNNPTIRQELINKGHELLKKYSWNKTSLNTLKVYHQALN